MEEKGNKKRWPEFYDQFPNCRIRDRMNDLELKSNNLSDEMNTLLPEKKKITPDAVRQWVGGYTRPDLARLPAIADVLECSIDYLMGRESQPTKALTDIESKTGLTAKAVNRLYLSNYSLEDNQSSKLSIKALNALLESDKGLAFLRSMCWYLFENENYYVLQQMNRTDEFFSDKRIAKYQSDTQITNFLKDYQEIFNSKAFIRILQDSRMTEMQELLSDLRKEIYEE